MCVLHMRGHRLHRRVRTRRHTPEGWEVRARIERFGEPALLLLLRERPRHGYELLEQLPELIPDERIDMGNLYRVLRALEEDGIVSSEWRDDLPGPTKRTYELTKSGRELLDTWAAALRESQRGVDAFLTRYEDGRR
jgi:PadR family transcriptional regulator PadR